MAASTASSAAVPDEANSTTSASGCVATAISPSAPQASGSRRRRLDARSSPRTSSSAVAVAIATRRGEARHLFDEARNVLAGRERDDLRRRSGCASATASALWPIDPVEPRMAIRFMLTRKSVRLHGNCR